MTENGLAIDLAVGRSSVRQRILALLMAEPGVRLHLREIQRRVGTSPGTASRELTKLVAAGLVDREAEGHQVYFRASASPFATMLRSVIVAMPAPQIRSRPAHLPHASAGAHDQTAAEHGRASAAAAEAPSPADTNTGVATPAVETEPTTLPVASEEQAADFGPNATSPVVPEPPVETPNPTDTAPRVLRPTSSAPIAKPDPLGLRIAGRLADSVREIYGDSLRGIYLFGARAAGPTPADADVETIVVLDRVDHYGAELERTSQICAALSHEMNVIVSRMFVSEADWDGAPDGVAPAVRAEAVAV